MVNGRGEVLVVIWRGAREAVVLMGDPETVMIGARVRVVNEAGSFSAVVCAESLREVEQTAKAAAPITLFDTHA